MGVKNSRTKHNFPSIGPSSRLPVRPPGQGVTTNRHESATSR